MAKDSEGFNVNDVVVWIGTDALWAIKKINSFRPRIISNVTGQETNAPYYNLRKVGTTKDKFGYCQKCNNPGRSNVICKRGKSKRGKNFRYGCDGMIVGNRDWRMKELAITPVTTPTTTKSSSESKVVETNPMISQAIDNLCMVLSMCGETEMNDEIIQEINLKMKTLRLRDSVTIK
jgi:hypothetical protein